MKQENKNLEKLSDYVTLTIEHRFTDEELLKKSSELAALTKEIDLQDAKKKATAAEYKNKIDVLKARVKLTSDAITNRWENQERACELYLDFESKVRIYDDKITGDELKREPFHQSDFEKRQMKMFQDEQIDENNSVGDFAENKKHDGVSPGIYDLPDENGFYKDNNGNMTDLRPLKAIGSTNTDVLDKVIDDKKKSAREPKMKPVPKDNLGPHYNKSAEFQDDEDENYNHPAID